MAPSFSVGVLLKIKPPPLYAGRLLTGTVRLWSFLSGSADPDVKSLEQNAPHERISPVSFLVQQIFLEIHANILYIIAL
jgi:hypothetical protein